MKDKKYLKNYNDWLVKFPSQYGLCYAWYFEISHNYNDSGWFFKKYHPLLDLVSPTVDDLEELCKLGLDTCHWGSDSKSKMEGVFTPLRQNIVLLLACLNGEL